MKGLALFVLSCVVTPNLLANNETACLRMNISMNDLACRYRAFFDDAMNLHKRAAKNITIFAPLICCAMGASSGIIEGGSITDIVNSSMVGLAAGTVYGPSLAAFCGMMSAVYHSFAEASIDPDSDSALVRIMYSAQLAFFSAIPPFGHMFVYLSQD
jgi:uncharacterized membrane protein